MRGLVVSIAVAASAVGAAGCKGAAKPAPAPTCASAAATIGRGMIKLRADLETAGIDPAPAIDALCSGDQWSAEVIGCYAAGETPRDLRACSERLTSDQRLHAREIQEDLYHRASAVGDGRSAGPTGIEGCDEYLTVVDTFNACANVSQEIKDAIGESVDAMRASWGAAGDDDASRAAVEAGCAAATDALRQTMAALGC